MDFILLKENSSPMFNCLFFWDRNKVKTNGELCISLSTLAKKEAMNDFGYD
jgi:hypothetical protein